ncbi:MAG TPA: arylesterase [Rhodanobacteraceae bacterium]
MRSWLPSCMLSCLVFLMAAPAAIAAPPERGSEKTILLLGDSLSAAHNIELDRGWPSLLQARLSKMRPPRTLINASISGETTSSGESRLPGLLKTYRPALVILELGANDGLRGLPLEEIHANLQSMITECRRGGAKVLLLGIELPVNYGPQYRDGLRAIYAQLAKENRTGLVPFLLQGIALDPNAMQEDGLHPTAGAQPRVLDNVWPALAPMLGVSPKPISRSGG